MTNQIVTLDVANGRTSFVSDIDASAGLIGGAAPVVPEPASIALVILGIAAFGVCKSRRHGEA
jgi:PEP-CTERM motif